VKGTIEHRRREPRRREALTRIGVVGDANVACMTCSAVRAAISGGGQTRASASANGFAATGRR
jgi:hypothetical protein